MDYRKNYFKIYFWQAVSVLLGFASLFLVIPYISSNKVLYGVYSVCTSLTLFFSYADLGFLSSGEKYAAEYFIRGERKDEIQVIGFTAFVMVAVFSLIALIIVVLGFEPKFLIPEVETGTESYSVARWLLFTLAVSCPLIIGQRILGLIFNIRVENYNYQRLMIVGNAIRILSVFFFFGNGRYMLVEYYLFYQLINLLIVVVGLLYAREKYDYSLAFFLNSFRFNKVIFDKVKKLTVTSLILTTTSILIYELDQVVISNLIGIEAVAIYGIALSVFTFVRSLSATVYSPYTSRYNHFVGLGDIAGLSRFVNKMILMFAPVLIVPILSLSLMSKPFVISWVGEQYTDSAILVSLVVFCFIWNFIKDPINQYFVSTERNGYLIKYGIATPLFYWLGVIAMIQWLGVESFAIMKALSPIICTIGYFYLLRKDYLTKGLTFIKTRDLFTTIITSTFFSLVLASFLRDFMPCEHSRPALLLNLSIMGVSVLLAMAASIPFNKELKPEVARYFKVVVNKMIYRVD